MFYTLVIMYAVKTLWLKKKKKNLRTRFARNNNNNNNIEIWIFIITRRLPRRR